VYINYRASGQSSIFIDEGETTINPVKPTQIRMGKRKIKGQENSVRARDLQKSQPGQGKGESKDCQEGHHGSEYRIEARLHYKEIE
jgi:hypothetical protein